MDKFVGKRLDGRYQIQEIIGIGGMAVVYKAYDMIEDRTVAIKILKEEFTSNEEFVRRFKNESKAIAMLSHPNIVKVYDVSFGDLIQYIVMEYIDGITLKEFIERQGSLRWRDAVHFANQILKGLQHAHDKGIVHRDVKPQNIIVLPDHTIKVTDFGIARFARSEQRTITDKAIGSVHYISPEQARGERTDEKADIYSVGVIMYEMLTGQVPFQAESAVSVAIMQLQREPKLPTEINSSIPLGLEQITMHAMQKSVERRYQSAAEMLCDLDAFRKDPDKTFSYAAFVDNSPTKYVETSAPLVPLTGDETVEDFESEDAVLLDDSSEEETKSKNNVIPILTGVAVTLLIILGILAWLLIPRFFQSTQKEVECPNFIGKTEEEIKKSSNYKKFDIVFEQEESEEEIGVAFAQNPVAGKPIKKGAHIVISISKGRSGEKVQVPDITNMNEQEVVDAFKRAGLDADSFVKDKNGVYSDKIDAGLAVSCDPDIGSWVYLEDKPKITVFFSLGPEPTDVPSVYGNNKEDAKMKLESAGFVCKFVTEDLDPNESYVSKGYAIKQSASSSNPQPGDTITVTLSSGTVRLNVTKQKDLLIPVDVNGNKVSFTNIKLVESSSNKAVLVNNYSVSYEDTGALDADGNAEIDGKFRFNNLVFTLDEACKDDANDSNVMVQLKLCADLNGSTYDVMVFTLNVKTGEISSSDYKQLLTFEAPAVEDEYTVDEFSY